MDLINNFSMKHVRVAFVASKVDKKTFRSLLRCGFDACQITDDIYGAYLDSACLILVDAQLKGVDEYFDSLEFRGANSNRIFVLINATDEQSRRFVVANPRIRGAFPSDVSSESLSMGLAQILRGGDWLPRSVCELLVERYRRVVSFQPMVWSLSGRERDVMLSAADGLSNQEIAQRLGITLVTVKNHVHSALSKLGASNRAHGASLVLGLG